MSQLAIDFGAKTTVAEFLAPAGYSGLYGFHKYWGKKPAETVSFLLDRLSNTRELVVDPFVGSGAIAREAFIRRRRFLGCDINPTAIALSRLIVCPPSRSAISSALRTIEAKAKNEINKHYLLQDGSVASHYLWNGATLRSVWTKPSGQRSRCEFSPTAHDLGLYERYEGYVPNQLRPLRIFMNSRINARAGMDWPNLFTGRATRCIELLRTEILSLDDPAVKRALLLVLTAAVGQMSRMVFAIERRGKKNNDVVASSRVEVGSWVIGFWTPELHFEVNPWNCFANKANKLLLALNKDRSPSNTVHLTDEPRKVADGDADIGLSCSDAGRWFEAIPNDSIHLVITDPPHGDRIPYLELSEIWNAILGAEPDYDQELVVSNARERQKDLVSYSSHLHDIFRHLAPKLTKKAIVAILFNSRSTEEWQTLMLAAENSGLNYRGRVPMVYSAQSVAQDNRDGALEYDEVVVFGRGPAWSDSDRIDSLKRELPKWSSARPD